MTRILIGFFFGLMVSGALTQLKADEKIIGSTFGPSITATLNAGVGPDGRMAKIIVDKNGYVICSTERPNQ